MEISELVQIVKDAICICEAKIQENSNMVLSEADLERHLSNVISSLLEQIPNNEFVVHNQISHYPQKDNVIKKRRDSQVDILIMKDTDIQKADFLSKGFVYAGDSIAMELKYIRKNSSYTGINNDLRKSSFLFDKPHKCEFFVIDLIEDESKRNGVEKCFDDYRNNPLIHTFIITKPSNNQNQ